MSTTEEDKDAADSNEKKIITERLAIKRRIKNDPNAMAFVIQDAYLYAFGLSRQSLKRQSRGEAVAVSTASIARTYEGQDIGLTQSVASKLGLGSYKTVYMPKK